ncbi:hypothetical protein D9M71_681360 [compost metagenome]
MLLGVIVAPLQALAAKTLLARESREPIQQLIGRPIGFLLKQPGHEVRHWQRVFAAREHFLDGARRTGRFALIGLVSLGKLRGLWLEAGQGIHVGLDLAGTAQEGTLRTGEHGHRRLWQGIEPLAADHRQG